MAFQQWPVGAIAASNFTHRNFSSANLTFFQCKSLVQISHFSCANHFSSTNLVFLQCKSCISPVQIPHFSSSNLIFLQCKSHFYPARLSNAHAHELHFEQVAGVSACKDRVLAVEVLALVVSRCGILYMQDDTSGRQLKCFTEVNYCGCMKRFAVPISFTKS